MSIEGKVVLIAGGSGALGHSVVPAFLAAGGQTPEVERELGRLVERLGR